MRTTLLRAALAATALVGGPALAVGQDHQGHTPTQPVVDETFTIPYGQFVRAFLAGGSTYRVEITGRGLQLRVAPVESGIQQPLVQPLLLGESPSGTVLFTIKPRADALYEIRSVGGEAGRAVTVKVTLQPKEVKDSVKGS